MTESARKGVAAIAIAGLLVIVWSIIEWRTAPPSPPKVDLPYPPAPAPAR